MAARAAALILPVLALTAAGCIHALPPRETPGPVVPPPAAISPPAPGLGRIYVDVVDGPVRVRVVKPITVTETVNDEELESEELEDQATCTPPCVLDLPLGKHLFAFPVRGAGGVDLVRVTASPSPTVYRRALGWRQRGDAGFVLGVLGASFGGASFVTGAALLPTGLAKDSHALTLAGGITLGVGALLTAAGIWAMANHPLAEQAGAGAQYALPEGDGSR
jgi:hypothetical protein